MRFVTMVRSDSDRPLGVVWLATLLLVTIIFGLALAHAAELPGKLRLDGADWLTVQHNLYVGFGAIGEVVEPLSVVAAWALVLERRGRRGFGLALAAASCVTIGLVEWFVAVSPMNTRLNGWTAATLPTDWTATRNQWEAGHIGHALLFGVALVCLAWLALGTSRTSLKAPD